MEWSCLLELNLSQLDQLLLNLDQMPMPAFDLDALLAWSVRFAFPPWICFFTPFYPDGILTCFDDIVIFTPSFICLDSISTHPQRQSALRCPLCWRGYELAFPLLKHGLWNGSVRMDAHIRKVRLPGRPPGKRFWLILYLLSAITTFIYLFLTFTIHSQNFHLFDLEKGVSIICIDPNIKGFHVFPLIGEEWHI